MCLVRLNLILIELLDIFSMVNERENEKTFCQHLTIVDDLLYSYANYLC